MRVLYLQGGFGNVCFQLIELLRLRSSNVEVHVSIVLTEKNALTSILKWNIHNPMYQSLLTKLFVKKRENHLDYFIVIKAILSKSLGIPVLDTYFFQKKLRNKKFNFGYYQDKNYLCQNKHHIVQLGGILRQCFYKEKREREFVIHYRGTDSDWAKENSKYYESVRKEVLLSDKPFLVITDDMDKAKLCFKGCARVEYQMRTTEEDFSTLVSTGAKFYMAPSTFSWWAAHALDPRVEVVMPKYLERLLGFYSSNALVLF